MKPEFSHPASLSVSGSISSTAAMPIINPKIPYLGPIDGGLKEGLYIYLLGSAPEDMTRFQINLLCGNSESSDIALHINPRHDGGDRVVFNTRGNGTWDTEIVKNILPFEIGETFEMGISVTPSGYKITVNKKEFYTFPHRLPVDRVRALQIKGDVSIEIINVIPVNAELLHVLLGALLQVQRK